MKPLKQQESHAVNTNALNAINHSKLKKSKLIILNRSESFPIGMIIWKDCFVTVIICKFYANRATNKKPRKENDGFYVSIYCYFILYYILEDFEIMTELKALKTPPDKKQITECLMRSIRDVIYKVPSKEIIVIVMTKINVETSFEFVFNWNIGNRKARHNGEQPIENYHYLGATKGVLEFQNGKPVYFYPPHIECRFAAFASLQEGVDDYVELIFNRKRYQKAREELLNGDLLGYCNELKNANYFTAPLYDTVIDGKKEPGYYSNAQKTYNKFFALPYYEQHFDAITNSPFNIKPVVITDE